MTLPLMFIRKVIRTETLSVEIEEAGLGREDNRFQVQIARNERVVFEAKKDANLAPSDALHTPVPAMEELDLTTEER